MIVVDANVLVATTIEGASTAAVARRFNASSEWVAPIIWRSEFRNALRQLLRARQLELPAALSAIDAAEELLTEQYAVPDDQVLALAIDSGCSAYDCEYVALATVLGTRLITLDRRLRRAFPEVAESP